MNIPHMRRFVIYSMILIVASTVYSQTQAQPQPQQEPSLRPTIPPIVVSLDPTITTQDYPCSGSFLGGRFEVHWHLNEKNKTIDFAMVAKTGGWVGFGVGPNQDKTGSDIIVGYVVDGQVKIVDKYATGNTFPRTDRLDVTEIRGHEVDGVTSIFFRRAFFTGDEHDIDLSQQLTGLNSFASLGSSDSFSQKHAVSDIAVGYVNFQSCNVVENGRGTPPQRVHAILMMVGWVGLPPLAIIATHYFKWAGSAWHTMHITLLLAASGCVYAGFIMVFTEMGGIDKGIPRTTAQEAHLVSGMLAFSLFCFQPLLGLYVDVMKKPNRVKVPLWPDKIHRYLGRTCFLFGIIALSTGADIWDDGNGWKIALGVLCGFWTILALYAKKHYSVPKMTEIEKVADTREIKQYGEDVTVTDIEAQA